MRIVNVITTDAGCIDFVYSFVIRDEQKSDEVVKKAEALFMEKAKDFGYDENRCDETPEDLLEQGWYESPYETHPSVTIAWSEILN